VRSAIRRSCCAGFAIMFWVIAGWRPAQAADPLSEALVGHWRQTTISFGEPRDEHLVLGADGTVGHWIVTANSRTPVASGLWGAAGKLLTIQIQDQNGVSLPFAFYQGQLVFPNINNRRGFWEKIGGESD
jgi:hypothetical protein